MIKATIRKFVYSFSQCDISIENGIGGRIGGRYFKFSEDQLNFFLFFLK
jgi:hypothetical protein